MTQQLLDSEEIVTELDISHLVIEDDTPVDNFQSEEQQRLLVELLYRTHLTSFSAVLGFEVSRYSTINDRACSVKSFSARKWRSPARCKAFASRIRSQMGSIAKDGTVQADRNPIEVVAINHTA